MSSVELPDSTRRVAAWLAEAGHPESIVMLPVTGRTAADAAAALSVELGQIAKSIVFRRLSDDAAVLVVASGDRRVDEAKVSAIVGPIGRADAEFVKTTTGFSIGGVCPVAHTGDVIVLIDTQLSRFDQIWAAAGHPHAVFPLSPAQLAELTGAPVAEIS
ncbi:prolyl-tRNA editing enzyme YbaK/EbsC (Cys-tRNA(Pro) deacylase) [Propionicimonas paludicola]|uniref:Prolyl-tRNA editing enzyme YbaK/EbsC (Cys-tRNA(Pro) deacylase) n=1 Tax=Propionicimonas paludicola TaxID=185243 RepID=A0A2A9CQP9_9ACTN|nr:YbaK/EbsC family protein [Propionicimonas paludicola]PFG16405.1 prolyl-tRNA editing enzyme YbaK/EbsC (Cys-tRNA(Pro) deacylase) [Propionicimonas paludicola]